MGVAMGVAVSDLRGEVTPSLGWVTLKRSLWKQRTTEEVKVFPEVIRDTGKPSPPEGRSRAREPRAVLGPGTAKETSRFSASVLPSCGGLAQKAPKSLGTPPGTPVRTSQARVPLGPQTTGPMWAQVALAA